LQTDDLREANVKAFPYRRDQQRNVTEYKPGIKFVCDHGGTSLSRHINNSTSSWSDKVVFA